jgi:hypothetical protein
LNWNCLTSHNSVLLSVMQLPTSILAKWLRTVTWSIVWQSWAVFLFSGEEVNLLCSWGSDCSAHSIEGVVTLFKEWFMLVNMYLGVYSLFLISHFEGNDQNLMLLVTLSKGVPQWHMYVVGLLHQFIFTFEQWIDVCLKYSWSDHCIFTKRSM